MVSLSAPPPSAAHWPVFASSTWLPLPVGGGALPLLELEGPAVALRSEFEPAALAASLRAGDPPVIGRIHDGLLLLDPRTLGDGEIAAAGGAVRSALEPPAQR